MQMSGRRSTGAQCTLHATQTRMRPPSHLAIMAVLRLCLTARGDPAAIAPPNSGPGGTPVNCRSILFRRQPYTGQPKTPMDKTYQPHAIESSWYQTWEQNNYFAPQGSGESYTIALPPPNVTGSLHMGHGFNNSIMD